MQRSGNPILFLLVSNVPRIAEQDGNAGPLRLNPSVETLEIAQANNNATPGLTPLENSPQLAEGRDSRVPFYSLAGMTLGTASFIAILHLRDDVEPIGKLVIATLASVTTAVLIGIDTVKIAKRPQVLTFHLRSPCYFRKTCMS